MRLSRWLVAAGLAWMPLAGVSGELLNVVNDTLRHDAELLAANDGVAVGREEPAIARAALLPRLDGGWGRSYNQIKTDNLPTTTYWQNGWMITLTQPVFDWERWVALRQANLAGARAELEYASVWQALVLRSANAYLDLLAASQELAGASDYLNAVTRQLALTQKLQAGGEATVIDVQEAQSRLGEAQLRQQDASRLLASRRRAVETLAGREVAIPEQNSLQQWVNQAQSRSFAVQLGELDVRDAGEGIEKARAQFLPVVNLSASHAPSGAASGYSEPTTTNSATLTISAPLFSGGENRARIRQATAKEDQARHQLLAASRKSAADTRDWLQRFNDAQERARALGEITEINHSVLAATRQGYLAGSRSNLDVLRAQEALFTSRTQQVRARYEMLSAFLALKAEVASLSLGDVQLIDSWLAGDAQR